jgi:uncharacterized protein YbbK (DUF523 family)
MILVSACLAGIACKYNGGDNRTEGIPEMVRDGQAVPVCPEQLGGLPTPRFSCEIIGGRVINTAGEDVTGFFERGAEEALRICMKHGCTEAVLKSNSPSCGCCGIYDGTFSHTVIPGMGIFAAKLAAAGIPVRDEKQYLEEIKNGSVR